VATVYSSVSRARMAGEVMAWAGRGVRISAL
jgi:hypothetical protein